ncbi:MAG TPA: hypothetical protein VI113_03250 [Alphaproteobacteria bacterium]
MLEDFAERRGLTVDTRQTLLDGGDDLVGLRDDWLPERVQRLALTMFRVLQMDEAAVLRANLIGTYLQQHRTDPGTTPLLAWLDAR